MIRARSHSAPRLLKHPGLLLFAAVAACALGTASAYAYALMPNATPALSVKLTTHPAAYSRSTTARFTWKAVSATATLCRLDTGAYKKCKKRATYKNLLAGTHTFWVRVSRGKKAKVAKARWTVDLTSPTVPTVTGGSACRGCPAARRSARRARRMSVQASPATSTGCRPTGSPGAPP